MLTFVLFIVAVALYAIFLLWCFMPLLRLPKRIGIGWLRVSLGAMLFAANFVPPLAWPWLIPLAALDMRTAERALAIVLFPRTLPNYLRPIHPSELRLPNQESEGDSQSQYRIQRRFGGTVALPIAAMRWRAAFQRRRRNSSIR
jgi:hypothetical protein